MKINLRAIVSITLGALVLAGAYYFSQQIIDSKQKPRSAVNKTVKTVYVESVKNETLPIIIESTGTLQAAEKIELFSEVQGVFKPLKRVFKPGQYFQKGELLLEMDASEFNSSLIAQRSVLYDNLIALMPDLKFDYPESYNHWKTYLDAFDIQSSIKPLPEPIDDKEKFFINGKQVVSSYYNIKNLEERLRKYKIYAPFSGMLTEALVDPGTLIRSGQKLGTFTRVGNFELATNISQKYLPYLKVGKAVKVKNTEGTQSWNGSVRRINPVIDQATQTVTAYVAVSGRGMTEGQFMEAEIVAQAVPNVTKVSRNLLIDDQRMFYVQNDTILGALEVTPVHYTDEYVLVQGLPEGTRVLSRSVPGAYEGMVVTIAEQ